MNITYHKNGEIKTLVDEAPYNPGYEDVGFEPIPFAGYVKIQNELTNEEIKELSEQYLDMDWQTGVIDFARAILRKAQEK